MYLNLASDNGAETIVWIKRVTAKAILVKGSASECWFPKKAIGDDGQIAAWVPGSIERAFLFQCPAK
jgi:hypothetical protein